MPGRFFIWNLSAAILIYLQQMKEGYRKKAARFFLDKPFAKNRGYKIGDTISVSEDGDSELLKKTTYTVVGIGSSPLYISFNRGNTTLGSGEVSGFGYILPEDFEQEAFTQIYIMVHESGDVISYTDAYDNLIRKIQKRVEGIEKEQCSLRYEEIVAEANEKLDDARKELEDGKKESEEKLRRREEKDWMMGRRSMRMEKKSTKMENSSSVMQKRS